MSPGIVSDPSHLGELVGRKPDPERRAELLQEVVSYLLDSCIHQTSLRPLANELGTSTYTFVYHFGSKEKLITMALDQVAQRAADVLTGFGDDGTVHGFVRDWWDWNVDDDQLETARIITDARSLVRVQPELFQPFVERTRHDFVTALAARLSSEGGVSDDACMMVAALTGTLAELVGAEDADRGAATVERLLLAVAA